MNLQIDVLEPMENGKIVFEAIAPSKKGNPKQGRISMLIRLTNNETNSIKIERIEILGQVVSTFEAPLEIAGKSSIEFQNFSGEGSNSTPLIINEPFPPTAKIDVFAVNDSTPIAKVVSIIPHTNDGGPLLYPGKVSDLLQNESWGTSSNHPSNHQVFGLDMGVLGWNNNHWSEQFPGAAAIGTFNDSEGNTRNIYRKESYRIYGMPIYAMTDGTVGFALNDHEERPTTEPDPDNSTKSSSQGMFNPGGNQIFVKTGNEISLYGHLQPGSIPQELLQVGAPVKKGQYLGKVGLTGATDHPHVHIHVKKEPSTGAPKIGTVANACDKGFFRPMTFKGIQSLTQAEATTFAALNQLDDSDWTKLTNHSAPQDYSLLYPSVTGYRFIKKASDSNQYIGVWREGNEIDLRVKAKGWDAFTKKWEELTNDNFRLVEINAVAYIDITNPSNPVDHQFIGLYKRGSGGHYLFSISGWDNFTKQWDELSKKGLRLIDMTTYVKDGTRFFAGVFREGNDRHFLISITGWDAFSKLWDKFSKDNLRLIDLESYREVADRQYIGVFREGHYGHSLVSLTGWDAFTKYWEEANKNGLRLMDLETFSVGKERQFIGVFRQGTGGFALESMTGYENFVQFCEKHNSEGLRLVDIHVEQ